MRRHPRHLAHAHTFTLTCAACDFRTRRCLDDHVYSTVSRTPARCCRSFSSTKTVANLSGLSRQSTCRALTVPSDRPDRLADERRQRLCILRRADRSQPPDRTSGLAGVTRVVWTTTLALFCMHANESLSLSRFCARMCSSLLAQRLLIDNEQTSRWFPFVCRRSERHSRLAALAASTTVGCLSGSVTSVSCVLHSVRLRPTQSLLACSLTRPRRKLRRHHPDPREEDAPLEG